MVKKSLITELIDQNIINAQMLAKAQEAALKQNSSPFSYLLLNDLVDAQLFAQACAAFLHKDYIQTIDETTIDQEHLLKLPLQFLREKGVIPLKQGETIILVVSDPTDFQSIDELQTIFSNKHTELALATRATILDALNYFYPLENSEEVIEDLEDEAEMGELSFGEIDESDIMSAANDAPIIKLVNYILLQAVKMETTDIHIGPQEKEIRVRCRVDGIMRTLMNLPKRVQAALTSRIKIMAQLNIAEKRLPQDGRIEIKVNEKAYDIRVSVLPAKFGENVVMRILDKERSFTSLDKMGFSESDRNTIESIIAKPNGIILVTGPTGSGKTTTLYSVLHKLNTPDVNIITVEDPVEYKMAGIVQVQVASKVGLTFAAALRSILRQDPDIVMIGETRDQETAQIAIQAALTGHLVLTTLHTNSAPASITRLIDMGIEPFLIGSSLAGIIAQRLVRKLCSECKQPYTPSEELLKSLGKKTDGQKLTFYKPKGCSECSDSGYKGRIALFEIMKMSDDIVKLTMERASTNVLRNQAVHDGMSLLIDDGFEKIKQGITTVEEVLAVASVHEQ